MTSDTPRNKSAPERARTEPRPEKVAAVAEIRRRLSAGNGVVLAEYRGLDTKALSSLRAALRPVGGSFVVFKNTMVRLAAQDLSIDCDHLLVGPTGLAFADAMPDGSAPDPSAVAKVLVEFRRNYDKLIIKGGVLGSNVVDTVEVERLSKLPPVDVMRAMVACTIAAPLQRTAGLLAAPLREMAGLLSAPQQNFAGLLRALIEKAEQSA